MVCPHLEARQAPGDHYETRFPTGHQNESTAPSGIDYIWVNQEALPQVVDQTIQRDFSLTETGSDHALLTLDLLLTGQTVRIDDTEREQLLYDRLTRIKVRPHTDKDGLHSHKFAPGQANTRRTRQDAALLDTLATLGQAEDIQALLSQATRQTQEAWTLLTTHAQTSTWDQAQGELPCRHSAVATLTATALDALLEGVNRIMRKAHLRRTTSVGKEMQKQRTQMARHVGPLERN